MAYFLNVVSYHAAESTVVVVLVLKKKQELSDPCLFWVIYESTKRFDGDLRSSNLINVESSITRNIKINAANSRLALTLPNLCC